MKFDIQHFRFNHARTADMLCAMNCVKDACELCGEKITEVRMGLQFDADICLIFWDGNQSGEDWEAIQFCKERAIKIIYFPAADVEVPGELDTIKLEQFIKQQVLKYYG